jgi:outer membrane protein OmpA-like peptidoglycan-associated protein
MKLSSSLTAACAVLLGGVALAGCASHRYVDTHVAVVQGDVNGVKTDVAGIHTDLNGVHGHLKDDDGKLAGLDQTTREALQRADAAGKLAQGKFAYSMVLSDDTTKFKVNGSTLAPEAEAKLADFAAKLKSDDKNVYIEIQGYTDGSGSAAANYRLGDERAEAVRRALSKDGVALNRMSTISYGRDNPVASNKTRKGRAQNRRVVLVVLQ